jgi:hypothetical protein
LKKEPVKTSLAFALVLLALPMPGRAALTPSEIQTLDRKKIEKALPQEHPSSYYAYVNRLFSEGKKDDAIRWFYIGQLRYRIYLKSNPQLDPSGDPALSASLNATVGKLINEYAGGNPKIWADQIVAALAWDEKNPDGFNPKEKSASIRSEIREGLAKFEKQIRDGADKIREERAKRGMENRN